VAWLAAIHSKAAGVVFFCAGGDVRAGHETEKPPA
jgi:enoyl-CoA hydratase/carnithine racemase